MRTPLTGLCLAVVLAVAAGCGGNSSSKPPENGGGEAFAGEKTFQEAFDADSNWPQKSDEFATYGIAEGQFLMLIKQTPRAIFVGPNDIFSGGQVSVRDSVQKVEVKNPLAPNNPSMTMGLLCRWNEEADAISGYGFHISTRKGPTWTINRSVDGKTEVVQQGRASFDPSATIALEASCIGDELVFKIDGQEVARANDSTLETGSNGILGVGVPTQKPPLTAVFDNYELEYDEQLAEG